MVLTQFNDAQGPFQGVFGELLLWLISWVALLLTMAACGTGFFAMGNLKSTCMGLSSF
jgi:hypothetical protein